MQHLELFVALALILYSDAIQFFSFGTLRNPASSVTQKSARNPQKSHLLHLFSPLGSCVPMLPLLPKQKKTAPMRSLERRHMKNPKGVWKTFLSSGAMGLLRELQGKSGNRGANVDVDLLLREHLGVLAKNNMCHHDHQRKTDQTFYLIWAVDSSSGGETGWLWENIQMGKIDAEFKSTGFAMQKKAWRGSQYSSLSDIKCWRNWININMIKIIIFVIFFCF